MAPDRSAETRFESAEAMAATLALPLWGRLAALPRVAPAGASLAALAPEPRFAERLARLLDRRARVTWVAGLGEAGEELPVAVGIAEQTALQAGPVLLVRPGELPAGEAGSAQPVAGEAWRPVLESFLPEGSAACGATGTGIQRVYQAVGPGPTSGSALEPARLILAGPVREDTHPGPPAKIDQVVVVVPFRDQPRGRIEAAVRALRAAGYPLAGLVAYEPEEVAASNGELLHAAGLAPREEVQVGAAWSRSFGPGPGGGPSRRVLWWATAVAALLVAAGFLILRPMLMAPGPAPGGGAGSALEALDAGRDEWPPTPGTTAPDSVAAASGAPGDVATAELSGVPEDSVTGDAFGAPESLARTEAFGAPESLARAEAFGAPESLATTEPLGAPESLATAGPLEAPESLATVEPSALPESLTVGHAGAHRHRQVTEGTIARLPSPETMRSWVTALGLTPTVSYPSPESSAVAAAQETPAPEEGQRARGDSVAVAAMLPGQGGPYAVLCGSFRRTARGEREVRRLRALGLAVELLAVRIPERGVWHRVIVGPAGAAADVRARARRLVDEGTVTSAQVVAHAGRGRAVGTLLERAR